MLSKAEVARAALRLTGEERIVGVDTFAEQFEKQMAQRVSLKNVPQTSFDAISAAIQAVEKIYKNEGEIVPLHDVEATASNFGEVQVLRVPVSLPAAKNTKRSIITPIANASKGRRKSDVQETKADVARSVVSLSVVVNRSTQS